MTEEKSRYFKELTLNLQHEGFTVGPEEDGLLPVELDGQRLCRATESGGIRYRKEDVSGDSRGTALERVTDITKATAEYMGQMEAAPQLAASGLKGDYRLLADFNDTVLFGGDYGKAKLDFATRSGLVPHSALFALEQLTEVYRSIHETLDSGYPITVEREKLLEKVAEQIEQAVPDLQERVSFSNQKELEAGMQYGQTM